MILGWSLNIELYRWTEYDSKELTKDRFIILGGKVGLFVE